MIIYDTGNVIRINRKPFKVGIVSTAFHRAVMVSISHTGVETQRYDIKSGM